MVRPSARPRRLGGSIYRGGYWSRTLESNEVGNWSQGGCTAEGTVFEIRLTLRVVVMVGRRAAVRRAELHQERGTTRGHEAHRDIGTKEEHGQQCDGQHIGPPSVTETGFHTLGLTMPE